MFRIYKKLLSQIIIHIELQSKNKNNITTIITDDKITEIF